MSVTPRGHRLKELSLLEDGWLGNGEGVKPDPGVLAMISGFVSQLEREGRALPAIYPMAQEAGLSLAWRFPAMNVTLRAYSSTELELSRFNPQEEPPTRRANRQSITFSDIDAVMVTFKAWLSER